MKLCTVAGCSSHSATYSRYCNYHRNRDRTHGHPEQTAVTKHELKPYIKAVHKYLSERSKVEPEPIMKKAWDATVARSNDETRLYERGKPSNLNYIEACWTIADINYHSDHMKVAEVMMAMGYWWEHEPKRFKSDQAFTFQAVRMLRRLSPSTGQQVYGADGKLVRSRYPRVGKMTMQAHWQIILDMEFVGWGMAMAKEDKKAQELKRRDKLAERALILG